MPFFQGYKASTPPQQLKALNSKLDPVPLACDRGLRAEVHGQVEHELKFPGKNSSATSLLVGLTTPSTENKRKPPVNQLCSPVTPHNNKDTVLLVYLVNKIALPRVTKSLLQLLALRAWACFLT